MNLKANLNALFKDAITDENITNKIVPRRNKASQGNFLMVDVRAGLGRTGQQVFQAFLKKGVLIRPLDNYGFFGAVRITVGTAQENEAALAVIARLKSE